MEVYIKSYDNWVAIYSAASGDLEGRFSTEQDAIDYAARWNWIIVQA